MKQYSAYKDSGIEWAPRIPIDWQARPVKGVFDVQLGKMLQNDAGSPDDLHVPYLKALHVNWGIVDTEDLPEMWAGAPELKQYGVRDGDLLVCEGGEVGRSGIVYNPPKNCIIQNALHRVRVENGADIRFLMYVLHAVASAEWFSILCNKATIAHFTREKLTALKIPIPNNDEQEQVADFLDCKVAQIDQLVAKKERMIELLKEERAAVINHAVTKGLDPNVEMKDSGIDWVGKIPQRWDVRKLKQFFVFEKGKNAQMYTNEYVGANPGEYPVFSGQTENEGVMGRISSFDYDTGDVLLATTVGAKAMTTRMISGRFSLSQNCALFLPRKGINVRYYRYYVDRLFDYEKGMISLIMQPSLRFEDLVRYWILMPPRNEQDKIADFLDNKTNQIEGQVSREKRLIDLLKEYRTALISEAVTGKIDVSMDKLMNASQ
jgi:type I restriction enzyme S subunit